MIKFKTQIDHVAIWVIDGALAEGGPHLSKNDCYCWFKNGKLHREDGPAIVALTERKRDNWYLNGVIYYFEDWLDKAPISIEEKVIVKLQYG